METIVDFTTQTTEPVTYEISHEVAFWLEPTEVATSIIADEGRSDFRVITLRGDSLRVHGNVLTECECLESKEGLSLATYSLHNSQARWNIPQES